MKKRPVVLTLFLSLCCAGAAWASVTEARPLPPGLMRGVLYLTACVEEVPNQAKAPEAVPASSPNEAPPDAQDEVKNEVKIEQTVASVPPTSEGIEISNLAKAEVNIDELLSLPREAKPPKVLILHSHGCEAYTPTDKYSYDPGRDFRTTDKSLNVVRVGDEIQRELEAQGVTVLHDTTLCDEPDFNKSYATSLSVAKKYLAADPDIGVVLDVHRDSIVDGKGSQVKTKGPDGASQLMFVMGTDMGGLEHPLWRQNLSFALNLQRRLIDSHPGLMRPINLRSSRFNQHLTTGSLIVEVGSDGNTLEEALAAAKIFGRELGEYLTGK